MIGEKQSTTRKVCVANTHIRPHPLRKKKKLMICTYGIPRREQVQAAHSSLPAMRNSLAQQTGNRATVQQQPLRLRPLRKMNLFRTPSLRSPDNSPRRGIKATTNQDRRKNHQDRTYRDKE